VFVLNFGEVFSKPSYRLIHLAEEKTRVIHNYQSHPIMFSLLALIEKTKSSYFIEEYFIPGIFIIFNEPNVMITLYKPRDTDINNILNLLTTLVVLF